MRRLSRNDDKSSVWYGAYRSHGVNSLSLCQNKNNQVSFRIQFHMSVNRQAGRARMSPLGLGFLAVASVGWGLNFPIMKHLLTEWPPLASRGLCGIVGAAALALIALSRGQKFAVPRHLWVRLILVSLLTIGGWVAFMGLALLWLNASEAAVLAITIPAWGALLAGAILVA